MLNAATDRGPVIEWDGDFFGAAASLAARVASPGIFATSSEAADVHP